MSFHANGALEAGCVSICSEFMYWIYSFFCLLLWNLSPAASLYLPCYTKLGSKLKDYRQLMFHIHTLCKYWKAKSVCHVWIVYEDYCDTRPHLLSFAPSWLLMIATWTFFLTLNELDHSCYSVDHIRDVYFCRVSFTELCSHTFPFLCRCSLNVSCMLTKKRH